ncbi:MAG: lamin tail domain-containing protein, partial [Planctomycetes bacterium]|nr:lamin tail domain-containing protein [Planctomycetota bacterium]
MVLSGLSAGPQLLEVIAEDSSGTWQDARQANSFAWTVDPALSRVLINEVLATNDTAYEHEGTFPDVIELYNDSPSTVSLAGMSISDKLDHPEKFVFAAGTTIAPGGYLLLYADGDATTSGIHLPFKLDGDGEGVFLFDQSGGLVDSIEFGMQIADLSIGRVGLDRHWQLNRPTPGGPNAAQPTGDASGVVINEWFTNGQVVLTDDFIELYNPDTLPVDLVGMYITDNPANQKTKHQFRRFDFLPAGGFKALKADDKNDPGHLDFQL